MKRSLFFILPLLSGCGGAPEPSPSQVLEVSADCDAAAQPCSANGAAGSLTLRLVSPRAMQPFQITADWKGVPLASMGVSFEMVGMEMGENRYRLLPDGKGGWTAKAVLPLCIAGRSDWVAEVEIKDGAGAAYRARLPFTIGG